MTRSRLILGSRGSRLALWQSHHVADRLKETHGIDVEIKTIKTQGDKILDSPLAQIGGKGLFVKEIEEALARGDIDLAVHSMKDVPTDLPPGLIIAAMGRRHDPRDALISRDGSRLLDLPNEAVIGTSSLRRRAQLLKARADLRIVDLRGNVETRLRKLDEGQFDAIILAAAGVERLGFGDRVTERIDSALCLSAVGQGSVGIEVREADSEVTALVVRAMNDADTFAAITAERALLRELEGGCQVPIGALGRIRDGGLRLDGVVASLDGERVFRDSIEGKPGDAASLGVALAGKLAEAGAAEVLAEIRAHADLLAKAEGKVNGH